MVLRRIAACRSTYAQNRVALEGNELRLRKQDETKEGTRLPTLFCLKITANFDTKIGRGVKFRDFWG